jgi:K(+)-stimulated pyrophosphate-energized sodium pump
MLGAILAVQAYSPIATGAAMVAAESFLPKQVHARTDVLSSAARLASAIGESIAAAASAATALALILLFLDLSGFSVLDLSMPFPVAGLLLGGVLPFLFTAGAALRQTFLPCFVAPLLPVAIGILFGSATLAGMLLGSLLAGAPLALGLAAGSSTWSGARMSIESGNLGGAGSDAHRAAVTGSMFGLALGGAAPVINVLLKVMAVASVLTIGFCTTNGLLG